MVRYEDLPTIYELDEELCELTRILNLPRVVAALTATPVAGVNSTYLRPYTAIPKVNALDIMEAGIRAAIAMRVVHIRERLGQLGVDLRSEGRLDPQLVIETLTDLQPIMNEIPFVAVEASELGYDPDPGDCMPEIAWRGMTNPCAEVDLPRRVLTISEVEEEDQIERFYDPYPDNTRDGA